MKKTIKLNMLKTATIFAEDAFERFAGAENAEHWIVFNSSLSGYQ